MKGIFLSRTVIIDFSDNPYQENNFKSHLNGFLLCKKGEILSHLQHLPLHFTSLYLFVLTFSMKSNNGSYKSH